MKTLWPSLEEGAELDARAGAGDAELASVERAVQRLDCVTHLHFGDQLQHQQHDVTLSS